MLMQTRLFADTDLHELETAINRFLVERSGNEDDVISVSIAAAPFLDGAKQHIEYVAVVFYRPELIYAAPLPRRIRPRQQRSARTSANRTAAAPC